MLSTLFEVGDRRMSCASGTAVLDMMLSTICLDHSATLAHRVAEHCLHERIRDGASRQRAVASLRSGHSHPKLVKAMGFIEQAGGTQTLAQIAGLSDLSPRQLLRIFQEQLRESPGRYRLRTRLERARNMLLQTDLPVTQIAQSCGFVSPAHFSRAFRQRFGKSPTATRHSLAPLPSLTMDVER